MSSCLRFFVPDSHFINDPDLKKSYAHRRVCVTGGAGFVGSHLCKALVDLGADVSIIDDLSSGSWDNLEPIATRIRFVEVQPARVR